VHPQVVEKELQPLRMRSQGSNSMKPTFQSDKDRIMKHTEQKAGNKQAEIFNTTKGTASS